jgi:hypothetical protein
MDVPSYNDLNNSNPKISQTQEPLIDSNAIHQQFQPPFQGGAYQGFQPPHQVQPPVQNFQPPTQAYPPPVENFQPPMQTYQPPIQGGYQSQIHPQAYNQPIQNTHTNNVIVIGAPTVSPILITRNVSGYPRLDTTTALIILILNILFPGIGTIVMGCQPGVNSGSWICIGILQMFLTLFIIGWIWSIITGIICLSNARQQ